MEQGEARWAEGSAETEGHLGDGSLDEIDADAWRALAAEPVEPPKDWTGPLDNLDTGDVDELDATAVQESEEYFADDRDPWCILAAAESIEMDSSGVGTEEAPLWARRLPKTQPRRISVRLSGSPGVFRGQATVGSFELTVA